MDKVPMTVRGEKLLRDELEVLLKRRPLISKAIGEARELGDLKENGMLIMNTANFSPKNIQLAGYEFNPLENES